MGCAPTRGLVVLSPVHPICMLMCSWPRHWSPNCLWQQCVNGVWLRKCCIWTWTMCRSQNIPNTKAAILPIWIHESVNLMCTLRFSLIHIPSANMEEAGFVSYTAASHQMVNIHAYKHSLWFESIINCCLTKSFYHLYKRCFVLFCFQSHLCLSCFSWIFLTSPDSVHFLLFYWWSVFFLQCPTGRFSLAPLEKLLAL